MRLSKEGLLHIRRLCYLLGVSWGLSGLGAFSTASAQALPNGQPVAQQWEGGRAQLLVGSYHGTLAVRYQVCLQLSLQDSALTGQYYYLRTGRLLHLTGRVAPDGTVTLRESAEPDTAATGWFRGRRQPTGVLVGRWQSAADTTSRPFALTRLVGTAPPAAARAQVRSKTYRKDFTIPVVTVPDKGVRQRLAECFSLESLLGETPASLRALVEERKENGPYTGLQHLSFEVAYNGRGLLSLTTMSEGSGNSVWYEQRTHNLDLNTGFPVILADEIRPEAVPAFLALGQRKLQDITRAYVPTQEGFLQPDDVAGVLSQAFSLGSTQEYTVSATGLTFDHPVSYDGLSNFVWKVLRGSFGVEFSHAELARFLQPDSPLRRLE